MVLALPEEMIRIDSAEGAAMLGSQPADAFVWSVLPQLATQQTQALCSVATSATMLNALGVEATVDPVYSPYAYFTQHNMLGECARAQPSHVAGANVSLGFVMTHGATLREWAGYLSCHADVERFHASASSLEEFRSLASAALRPTAQTPPRAVAINFYRRELGEVGGGHMSPLAAYDPPSDRFLLLDVARYKYGSGWATAASLFEAMNTTDASSWAGQPPQSRGFVLVRPRSAPPAAPAADSSAAPPATLCQDIRGSPVTYRCLGALFDEAARPGATQTACTDEAKQVSEGAAGS
jgi:hypothetical protein